MNHAYNLPRQDRETLRRIKTRTLILIRLSSDLCSLEIIDLDHLVLSIVSLFFSLVTIVCCTSSQKLSKAKEWLLGEIIVSQVEIGSSLDHSKVYFRVKVNIFKRKYLCCMPHVCPQKIKDLQLSWSDESRPAYWAVSGWHGTIARA